MKPIRTLTTLIDKNQYVKIFSIRNEHLSKKQTHNHPQTRLNIPTEEQGDHSEKRDLHVVYCSVHYVKQNIPASIFKITIKNILAGG